MAPRSDAPDPEVSSADIPGVGDTISDRQHGFSLAPDKHGEVETRGCSN